MERRGQERDLRIPNYTPQQIIQESPVKLPLAPILSTPPDRLIRGNAMASTRRGSSIFSPTQTLDPPQQHHQPFSPPPPHQPPVQKEPTSDPDPHTPKTAAASNTNTPPAPPPPPPQAAAGAATGNTTIRYRECLKNHAASMGGRVVDGCGEFMPGGEEGLEALRCAACDCHRNFHRKEISGGTQQSRYNNNNNRQSPLPQTQTPTAHLKRSHSFASSGHGPTPPTMVNFAGAAAENMLHQSGSGSGHAAEQPSKKRFRTKFSQDQKDRMHEFASKIGWRMQKQDDEELKQFCSEVGVQRQAFKVWMHNIKQATKKKETDDHHTTTL